VHAGAGGDVFGDGVGLQECEERLLDGEVASVAGREDVRPTTWRVPISVWMKPRSSEGSAS
jgi:hypothetical protein